MRFNAMTGTRFVTMRAAVFVLLLACPGVARAAEGSEGPFKSEKASAANKVYESAMRKAGRRLHKARRSAIRAYRTVLQSAMNAAMDADDLQESEKADDAIKELDGGVREYRMEALRRRVETASWINKSTGVYWYFSPGGRFGIGSKESPKTPKWQGEWEVIDLDAIIAGRHPCLWIITLSGNMQTMNVSGGCRDRGLHFPLKRAGSSSRLSKSSDDFNSKKVRQAHKTFDEALAKASKRYRKAGTKARSAYRKTLKSIKKSTMKAHDIDEARRLNKEIESLSGSSYLYLRKALAHAIGGTAWRPEGGKWRFDFHADGTYSYNQKGRYPWKAIDENTLVAGHDSFLWVLTFDNARKRAHLRGTNGNRRYDEWMTLVQD